MMEIKEKFWIVEYNNKRFLFEAEKEAIVKWKDLASQGEPKLNEVSFTEDNIQYRQVSWEKIAMLLAKGEGK